MNSETGNNPPAINNDVSPSRDIHRTLNENRYYAIAYLVHGEDHPMAQRTPLGLKAILDKLIEQGRAGDMSAIKEVLNRSLGGTIQNIKMDVTAKKMIVDDTNEEPGQSQLIDVPYRAIDTEQLENGE